MSNEKELLEAVGKGDKAKVESLLQADLGLADGHANNRNKQLTTLKFAVEKGHVEAIAVFAQLVPQLFKAKDENGQTVLHWAVQSNNHDSIRYLCAMPEVEKSACDNHQDEKTPFYYAVEQQNLDLIDLLLACGVPNEIRSRVNGKIVDIGQMAAALGYQTVLAHALNKQWATNEAQSTHYATPLFMAAEGGKPQIVTFLLEKGADVHAMNTFGCNAFYAASKNGHLEVINLLLEKMTIDQINIVDKDDFTVLEIAIYYGHESIVKALIAKGGLLNRSGKRGWTPLHLAARKGHETIVRHLLEKGADANAKTSYGDTPLRIAITNGHWKLIPALKGTRRSQLNNEDMIELDKNLKDPISSLTHFDFSNHDFDHNSADTFINIFKKASPNLTSINLSHNPKMGDGQLFSIAYSGVQKILYEMNQGISITTLDLSKSNLNERDIKSVEWALENSPHLKTVYLWEDSLEVLTIIFNSNVKKTQGKREGALIIMTPPSSFTNTQDREYEIKKYLQTGNFKALSNPELGVRDLLRTNGILATLQPEFIYYIGYWYDKYTADQSTGSYLNQLQTIINEKIYPQLWGVFLEGICNGLRENKITGTKLLLSNCFLDNDRLKMGLDRLCLSLNPSNGLEQLKNLTHLDLSHNQICHRGITELLNWLKNTPQLTYLDLSGNPLDKYLSTFSSGLARLSEALPSLQKLQALMLAKCNLESSHIQLLADAIQKHPALTHLNLNENNINNDDANVLANILLNPKTRWENREKNSSGEFSGFFYLLYLQQNYLKTLHLENNNIEASGAISLLKGLNENYHLTDLALGSKIKISEDIMGPIRWKLATNSRKTPMYPSSDLTEETIQETQTRLLQWQTVCHAWNHYAEAMDEKNRSPEEQAVLLAYYKEMVNRFIVHLSPLTCNLIWTEKMPEKPIPNNYYLVREKDKNDWQLFYIGKPPSKSSEKIPCEKVHGLKELLAPLSTEPMDKIPEPQKAEIYHVINQYHKKDLPPSSENLRIFYNHLIQRLEKLFMAFFCVSSKVMETSVSNSIGFFGKITGYVGDALCGADLPEGLDIIAQIVGQAVGLISLGAQILGKVLSTVGAFLELIDKLRQQNDLDQLAMIGTRKAFEALAKQLALHLTIMYQHQIFALSSMKSKDTSSLPKKVHETLHRHPKSPLEEFAEFMIAKIGLRCIAGEIANDNLAFANIIAKLSNLATTPHLETKKKEALFALLKFNIVSTEKTDIYLEKQSWKLYELCMQTAVFDYVTGNYYTGPFAERQTRVEKFGYIYGREKTDTQHLNPALFSTNMKGIVLSSPLPLVLQKFLDNQASQSGLELTAAYDTDIIHYFMAHLENCAQCIRVVFSFPKNSQNTLEDFKKALQKLIILSNDLKHPAVFISPIPQKEEHFIGGFIYQGALLLLNPFGRKTGYPDGFNNILAQLQQDQTDVRWLGVMKTRLCRSSYAKIVTTSTGPIVFEIIRYFLAHYTHEEFVKIWTTLKTTADKPIHHLSAYSVDLSELLESSSLLSQLDKAEGQLIYQQAMIKLRQSHYELLQQWVFEKTPPLYPEKSTAQTVFDALMEGMTLEQVMELPCYAQLQEELKMVLIVKPVTQVKLLEARMNTLENEMLILKDKIKDGQNQMTNQEVNDLKHQIEATEKEIINLRREFTALSVVNETQSEKICILQKELNKALDKIANLEERMNGSNVAQNIPAPALQQGHPVIPNVFHQGGAPAVPGNANGQGAMPGQSPNLANQ